MKKHVWVCMLLILLAGMPAALFSADEYLYTGSRDGEMRLGLSAYMLPLFSVELLKVSPFGLGMAYGITDRLDLTASLAPLNYYTAMVLPDMIAGNEYLFIYVGEAGARYHLSASESSFYIEGDLATLGIFGSSDDPESVLNDLKGGIYFAGGGFGFTGPIGNGTLSVGLNGYYWLGDESEVKFPIPLLKFNLLW